MIVASVNPQPQQTRPGNEMFEFGEMVPHHQGSALLNETTMLKVHPLNPQPPGPVDISVVPYEGFVQHPYTPGSGQPPLPPVLPSSQLHDAVVISSTQHPSQPHGTVVPTYIQQQPMAHPVQVQSQDSLLLGHYQHPHHDIVLPAPNQPYSGHCPGAVVFASQQNAYHQSPEMLPTQQQFVGQPQPAHFPGVLLSPTHQHAPYGPHEGVVHTHQPPYAPHDGIIHTHQPSYGPHEGVVHTHQSPYAPHDGVIHTHHQPPYPMHDPLSPSPHHSGLLHPSVMVTPHMPSTGLPGPPPVPAAAPPHQYPGQLHGSVIPAYHSQYPGSLQGTVVPGPPQHHNGMGPPPPHGTVIASPQHQHPNPLTDGVIAPLYQHQNLGSLHNPIHQHPGSLQGTIVSHQHTSPIHSAAVMPNQQQHPPPAMFGNLTSHQPHPGSMHSCVLPSPRKHLPSGRLRTNVGPSPSRQQLPLNGVVPPLPLQKRHYSSSKSNDNDSVESSSSSTTSSLSSSPKAHDNNTGNNSATTTTTTTSAAGRDQNPRIASVTTTTSQATNIQSKFFSTSTISSSLNSDSIGQGSSQHVPIKKLGPFASKPNGFSEPRVIHKVGQTSYKDMSMANDSTTEPAPNKMSPSTNGNHGPWELRTSYSANCHSIKSASVSPSLSTASMESIVPSAERPASACSQRGLPSQPSLIQPRMSHSVNGMLPLTNTMVGKMFGYQHSNGTLINGSSANGRSVSPPSSSSKKDQAASPTSNSDVDAITVGLEKSRLHDNQYGRQLVDNASGNNRRRYVSDSWRRQNSESAAASYSFPKPQQPLWSSSPKDQIKVVNLPVEQMKRPMYPLKMSKNSYSPAESCESQARDTLHLTFFLH